MSAPSEPVGYRTTTEEVLSRADIDVNGKTFLITGATSGLGLYNFSLLLSRGEAQLPTNGFLPSIP